jgi:hypothetical protein
MSVPEEFDGRYACKAVESFVRDEDREVLGHVGHFDVDEVGRQAAIEAARRLPGVVAVLRTSRRSYHLWALSVRPLSEWLDRGDDLDVVDDEYLAITEDRGHGVARITHKQAIATGDAVKPAPSIEALLDGDRDDGPLSRPHGDLLVDEFDAALDVVEDDHDWVGHSTSSRVFMATIGGRGGDA